ncbi:MAG TPA: hypothetical protein VMT86_04480 [Bryobacteraceae bacterium]|nr:hypothetical protein [Bryobacteraceae bacterium]
MVRQLAILASLVAICFPLRSPAQYYPRRGSVATVTPGPYHGPAVTFNGTVKAVTKKELIVDLDRRDPADQQETLTFRLSRKTRFLQGDRAIKPEVIAVGMHISLDATREGDQKLSAVDVIVPVPAKVAAHPDTK